VRCRNSISDIRYSVPTWHEKKRRGIARCEERERESRISSTLRMIRYSLSSWYRIRPRRGKNPDVPEREE
jgi:hypothetical protein